MRRNKIKFKNFKEFTKDDDNKTLSNTFDKIEQKIIKFMVSLGLIFLLLIWGYIPLIILTILGIDYSHLNEIQKIIYLMINDLLFILLLICIYRKEIKKNFQDYFGKNLKNNLRTSLRYWAVGLFIMLISNYIIAIVTKGNLAENEEAVRSLIDIAPWYMAFELMIYAPLTEEIIFRKSIKEAFQNKYLYVLVSGLIFGGLHVLSSINCTLDLLYLIPYCSLGFVFALLYQKTNNIFSSITVHCFHNTLALVLYLL